MLKKFRIVLVLISVSLLIAWIDPYRDKVSDGNTQFHQKKYSEAKTHYNKAEKYAPTENDKKKLSFNKGNADYMSEDYDSAIANYQRALQSEDKDVQKKAFFNMGNLYLEKENYKEAINAYINALKIDPNYDRAKKNIEYILLKKQQNQDKNKDNKNDNDNNDENNKQQKKDKQNQSQQDKQKQEQKARAKMSKEQMKNILKSMKNKPVRREKGNQDEKRELEKNW